MRRIDTEENTGKLSRKLEIGIQELKNLTKLKKQNL